jgi:8-oxo-dGTP pyrophosphatase MutT (NUDIX family)
MHPGEDEQILAAVLVALYRYEGELHVVLTKRREDLRRHAGEISFPGGRRDVADTDLSQTALREAEEEIGLPRDRVTLLGALERTSTFATNYMIHPFVGLISPRGPWQISAREVESVLEPSLGQLRAAKTRTQLERRGITFQTDAYIVGEHVIWGATARILENLLGRLDPLLDHAVD